MRRGTKSARHIAHARARGLERRELAVDWLLDRTQVLGQIGPRAIKEYKFTMTQAQMISVRWILLAVVPGVIMLLGLLVWFRRRF